MKFLTFTSFETLLLTWILGMGSASERRRYIVKLSLIGWAHTQNDPCSHTGVTSPLTHWSRVTHMRRWTMATWWNVAWTAPSHYLNKYWFILLSIGTLGTNLSEIVCNRNSNSFMRKCIWKYRLENVGHFVQGERIELNRWPGDAYQHTGDTDDVGCSGRHQCTQCVSVCSLTMPSSCRFFSVKP